LIATKKSQKLLFIMCIGGNVKSNMGEYYLVTVDFNGMVFIM